MQDAATVPASEIDQFVAVYLRDADSDPYRALRLAVADLIKVSIDARLTELELQRVISPGYLRQPPLDHVA
ncbi:hypothetical protein HCU64_10170 [Methylobacterium sp. C25]|uniref:hypothetical protein n=1 Tax=Methylobacterium sp. C25 TaxID=2721622 RepID=UPI001F49006F|nr:hypothetical protein [Methylobacterium sp. C25]MCE4224117.1 hypothetical protein [Methylobacterium sp. C25]